MDNKESQIEIPEQPIVAKTEEENVGDILSWKSNQK